MLRRTTLVTLAIVAIVALAAVPSSTASPGIGNVPQGTQTDKAYAKSGAYRVTNVLATTQRTSCYTPEVPFFTSLAPVNAYDGMTVCTGANTGEDPGPYPTQAGSNPGYPAATAMLEEAMLVVSVSPDVLATCSVMVSVCPGVRSPMHCTTLIGFCRI